MKKLFLVLLIASQGCIASHINVDVADVNGHGSAVIIESVEKKPVLKEAFLVSGDGQKRFDALDQFVKSWTGATSHLNAAETLISCVILCYKLDNSIEIVGFNKYVYLLLGTLASIGITDLACILAYHSYRFVRGGIEAFAPEKTVKSFNERLRLYYERDWPVVAWAGLFGSLCFNLSYGSIEKKLASSVIKSIL